MGKPIATYTSAIGGGARGNAGSSKCFAKSCPREADFQFSMLAAVMAFCSIGYSSLETWRALNRIHHWSVPTARIVRAFMYSHSMISFGVLASTMLF